MKNRSYYQVTYHDEYGNPVREFPPCDLDGLRLYGARLGRIDKGRDPEHKKGTVTHMSVYPQ